MFPVVVDLPARCDRTSVQTLENLKKKRHFVSLCLTRKTPFGAAIALHISLCRRAIRHESRLCGEPKRFVALVRRKTPANFVGVHYLAVPNQ
jgi:hypothetical protein